MTVATEFSPVLCNHSFWQLSNFQSCDHKNITARSLTRPYDNNPKHSLSDKLFLLEILRQSSFLPSLDPASRFPWIKLFDKETSIHTLRILNE